MNGIDGRKVRRLREDSGWTQQHLAELAGVDQATISRIEIGRSVKLYLETIEQLAFVFGTTVDALLTSRTNEGVSLSPEQEYASLAGWQLPEWSDLSERQKEDVKDFIRVLARRNRRQGEGEEAQDRQ